MHKRPHKIDCEATKAADFLCRYSYVSLRIHPESDPPHQCIYLAGDDVAVARKAVFERDRYRCTAPNCGRYVSWETGEMDHGGKTKVQRCSCPENLSTKCWRCHMRKHNRDVRLRDLRREQIGLKKCGKHPKAVWHDSQVCPACQAEKDFIALYDGL